MKGQDQGSQPEQKGDLPGMAGLLYWPLQSGRELAEITAQLGPMLMPAARNLFCHIWNSCFSVSIVTAPDQEALL